MSKDLIVPDQNNEVLILRIVLPNLFLNPLILLSINNMIKPETESVMMAANVFKSLKMLAS